MKCGIKLARNICAPQPINSHTEETALLVRNTIRRFGLIFLVVALAVAQDRPTFKVKVDMVVLSFQITDTKGKYVNGLKPKDFRILEDGIPQKLNTFSEGNQAPVTVGEDGTLKPVTVAANIEAATPEARAETMVGTSVFVLFDTSNYMYRGFVYASDAIADFIRGLDRSDSVAVYTYSRNLKRDAPLSKERDNAIVGLRKAIPPVTIRLCTTPCC